MQTQTIQNNKLLIWSFWQKLETTNIDEVNSIAKTAMHDNVMWHGFFPYDQLHNTDSFCNDFWKPLMNRLYSSKIIRITESDD